MTTNSGLDRALDDFFAQKPSRIADPFSVYAELRAQGPVYRYDSGPATLISSHAGVHEAMSGALPLSNNGWRHGEHANGVLAALPTRQLTLAIEILDFESNFVSRTDGATHLRLRRIASRAFTARRIQELRASIQAHTDDLIDDLVASSSPDLKTQVADRLPLIVICDMLGVPEDERPQIWGWAIAIAEHFSLTEVSLDKAIVAIGEFRACVEAMVTRLRATGEGPELALQLLAGGDREGLTSRELVALYLLLLFGGTETTTNLLGSGFYNLQRTDQWRDVVDDPTLVPNAVEEMLRFDPSVHFLPRFVLEDFAFERHEFHAGESVINMIGAANRDPAVFVDADRFDIRRDNAPNHLSLAFGPHYCLGAALARLEGEIVFTTLARRAPQIALANDCQVSYGGSAMQRTIRSLPVILN